MEISINNIKGAIFIPKYAKALLKFDKKLKEPMINKLKNLSTIRYPVPKEYDTLIDEKLNEFYESINTFPYLIPVLYRRLFNFYEANHFAQKNELLYYQYKSLTHNNFILSDLINLEDSLFKLSINNEALM